MGHEFEGKGAEDLGVIPVGEKLAKNGCDTGRAMGGQRGAQRRNLPTCLLGRHHQLRADRVECSEIGAFWSGQINGNGRFV